MEHLLGIDIGGTNTKVGLVTSNGTLKDTRIFPTDAHKPFALFSKRLVEEVDIFRRKTNLSKIGLGAPNVSGITGKMTNPPNFSWADDKPLAMQELLSAELGIAVWVENDANVAAIGQKVFGQAKELTDFIVVTVGTGIGTGIYCQNKLLRGSDGYAGEGGHIVVGAKGRSCGCGGEDHFESYCSVGNIKKLLAANRTLPNSYRESVKLLGTQGQAAESVQAIFAEAALYFAKSLYTLEKLFRPQTIFLTGGGITGNSTYFSLIKRESKSIKLESELVLLPDSLGESAILGAAAGALASA